MSEEIPDTSAARRILAYSFLSVFANDDTIDEGELRLVEKFALEDGVIDEEEKKVLSNLFSRVSEDTVEPKVWAEIQRLKEEHEIA